MGDIMGLLSGLMGHASQISIEELRKEFGSILVDGEDLILAFKLVRDMACSLSPTSG